ncbi:MAG: cobalamin-dependent protein, partial [Bacteroidota bacterium]
MGGKRILGATLAPCVHLGGLLGFLRLAEDCGHQTFFLGAAVAPADLTKAAREYRPDIIAVSYRLSPDSARSALAELRGALRETGLDGVEMAFGGTPPAAAVAREIGLFAAVFSGEEEAGEVLAYLRGIPPEAGEARYPQTLVERIEARKPYP